jgi:hypothetical protein
LERNLNILKFLKGKNRGVFKNVSNYTIIKAFGKRERDEKTKEDIAFWLYLLPRLHFFGSAAYFDEIG